MLIGMRSTSQLNENLPLFDNTLCPPLTAAEIAAVDEALPRATERMISPWLWSEASWGVFRAAGSSASL